MALCFTLNDELCEVKDANPHRSALSWLRQRGFTGAKEGCAEGECGACAIALLASDADGRACYQAVNSCLVPLGALHGRRVLTVEGVGAAGPHPVQRALIEHGASQCGYCTPGFVISLFCEYYRPGRSGYEPESISGNLCRCTGYRPIVDAARSLPAPETSDPRLRLLHAPLAPLSSVELAQHGARLLRPTTLPELFELWRRHPAARLLAGGTDLMVYANQRYERFQTLISLEALTELAVLEFREQELVIGAGVKLSALEATLARAAERAPASLRALLPLFSSRLIRNRATLGGNLATASPIGDAAPVLLALEAELTLLSAAGARRLPLSQFFLGYRQSALAPGELIVSVHVPLPSPRRQRFYKVSKRVLDDISAVAAAFALDLDAQGRVERLNVAFGGIAATPLRASALERAALGRAWSRETLVALAPELESLGTPLSDQRASAAYRRAMPGKLLHKFFVETTAAPGEAS